MKTTAKTTMFIMVMASLIAAAVVSSAVAADNLVGNPAFEAVEGDQPQAWTTHTWAGDARFTIANGGGRDRSSAVRIESTDGGDVGWETNVPVRPGSVYRLSGWIRTEDVDPGTGRGALLSIAEFPGAATKAVKGTADWTHVENVVRVGERNAITLICLFGGWGRSTGAAWYDDIRLEEIDLSGIKPEITIHAQQQGEPINPFIYGQFIEHLGRCIYGGIWAEMLEDRKFYFPIEADYDPYRHNREDRALLFPVVARSPWQIVGDAAKVTMVREDSFVGEHTPLLQPGVAIQQNDLGIVAGKEYVGYIWLKSPGGGHIEVTLSDAEGNAAIEDVGSEYAKYAFSFVAKKSTDEASLRISAAGGPVYVGTLSLMPADNVQGMRKDTLELIKQLDSPIYRWPGGNFVSGYDWRDGIGDRDRRPPRKNPAWTGVEHNDFGTDEYMVFCKLVNTEPLVSVNTGFGDAYSAAQWVEYCNAVATTIGGGWRAANGHPSPYGVKYWCVGNEMFGNWQLGYMQLYQYEIKHNEVVDKMRAVDPDLVLVGVGAVGEWSRGMLSHCADHMNWMSEHFYCGTMEDVPSHVQQIPNNVRRIANAHRAYRREIPELAGKDIRIAMDEWNYWYDHDRYVYGELGTRYHHNDALGVAAGLHEFFRSSDIVAMANYAQTVNVIGCIKTTKTDAFLSTTAMPLILYRKQFGTIPVQVEGNCELLAIDVAAAWTAAHDALTVAIVNPNATAVSITVNFDGANVAGNGICWTIAADDPMAYNDENNQPVKIVENTFTFDGKVQVPAYANVLYRLSTK